MIKARQLTRNTLSESSEVLIHLVELLVRQQSAHQLPECLVTSPRRRIMRWCLEVVGLIGGRGEVLLLTHEQSGCGSIHDDW
jgi:hypothetical protein